MRIEFLVEDSSGKKLLDEIMKKYIQEMPLFPIEYSILSYKGIGGLVKGADGRNVKAQQLLNDLPKRMKAIQAKYWGVPAVSIVIVLDNDTRDTIRFQEDLEKLAKREEILIDHVFCIAVEEMEAWLLGDRNALRAAYANVADRISSKYSSYKQDSICGTWECLADMLTKGGIAKFRKRILRLLTLDDVSLNGLKKLVVRWNYEKMCPPAFKSFYMNWIKDGIYALV